MSSTVVAPNFDPLPHTQASKFRNYAIPSDVARRLGISQHTINSVVSRMSSTPIVAIGDSRYVGSSGHDASNDNTNEVVSFDEF